MKLKKIIKECSLGELPSSKLLKMKWNPLTESEPNTEEPLNEDKFSEAVEGVELAIDGMSLNVAANVIVKALKTSHGSNAGKIVLAINKQMKIR